MLKQWLTHYFHDFRSEPALLDRLGRFIDDVLIPEALVTASEQLKLLIEKKQSENADKTQEKPFQFSTLPPTPILPVKLKRPLKVDTLRPAARSCVAPCVRRVLGSDWSLTWVQLLDIHPLEVARQLTLIEHNLYRTITPCECLRQRWTGKDKATLAPNIIALIDRFNKVSRWCCSEIVREKDLKSRAVILNRFILIASVRKPPLVRIVEPQTCSRLCSRCRAAMPRAEQLQRSDGDHGRPPERRRLPAQEDLERASSLRTLGACLGNNRVLTGPNVCCSLCGHSCCPTKRGTSGRS